MHTRGNIRLGKTVGASVGNLAVLLAILSAAPPDGQLVRARLIADRVSIQPGQAFRVGVLMEMRDGWHVYWQHPGDSGLPTTVRFTWPDGFSAGGLHWPVPQLFTQPGDVTGIGYGRSLLLWTQVTAPAHLRPSDRITIRATAQWLACKDSCVAGETDLKLELPVAHASEPANTQLFETWQGRLPVEPSKAAHVKAIQFGGDAEAGRPVIHLTWNEPVRDVQCFVDPGDRLLAKDPTVQTDGTQTTVRLEMKPLDRTQSLPATVDAVVAYTDAAGQRHGLAVVVPLARQTQEVNRTK